jgi:hypothetical protein
MAPRTERFAFRYRDPRTGKCIRARYVAERQEIAARYAEREITGPGEVRDVDPAARPFTPHLRSPLDIELRRCSERPPEPAPVFDAAEAFLLTVFLRRYVTYCARRGRYAAMNGAARLFAEISASAAWKQTSPAGAGKESVRATSPRLTDPNLNDCRDAASRRSP